jgi:hypothetical protein
MKNQYVGDVNDYKKYDMLMIVSEALESKKTLVAWMLTPNVNNNEGENRNYLSKGEEEILNPKLFSEMKTLQPEQPESKRNIDSVKEMFGRLDNKDKYIFYPAATPLNDSDFCYLNDNDIEKRKQYFDALIENVEYDADLFFFDPDNGIEVKSVKKGNKNNSKYLYWDEIENLIEKKKDVLIYQHYWHPNRVNFIKEKLVGTGLEVKTIFTGDISFLLITSREKIEKLNNIGYSNDIDTCKRNETPYSHHS